MNTGCKLAARGIPAALMLSALLAGCGGDSDPAPPPVPPAPPAPPAVTSAVPPSASQTVAGFMGYLQALVVSAADALEPVDTSMVSGPVDDTTEPQAVD